MVSPEFSEMDLLSLDFREMDLLSLEFGCGRSARPVR
ncbi:MAG: hypothetical protein HW380_2618 [Magnetococcales bacterium]|nr:hypothetical protein [Magnetococcales bacterium]